MRDLKAWLGDNKIYFETIAASFLSAMAFIVSYVQLEMMRRQNALLEAQTEIALQEVLPHFVVTARQLKDESGRATEDRLAVNNRGAVIAKLDSEVAVFAEVEVISLQAPFNGPVRMSLALNGYYAATVHSAEGQGEVLTLLGNKNNERLSELIRGFAEYAKGKECLGFLTVKRYLKLEYEDMLGRSHTEYYLVPLIFGGHEISDEEGSEAFEVLERAFSTGKIREFESLTAEDLFEQALRG